MTCGCKGIAPSASQQSLQAVEGSFRNPTFLWSFVLLLPLLRMLRLQLELFHPEWHLKENENLKTDAVPALWHPAITFVTSRDGDQKQGFATP